MKVLVTGATGIVGANLVRALLDASCEVRVLLRPRSDARALGTLDVERCEGDVLDEACCRAAVAGCEAAFHAAATFSYWGDSGDAQKHLAQRGTRNIIAAARDAGLARVVVTSSSVTLGSTVSPRVLDESAEFDEPDASGYVLSKVAQETTAFAAGRDAGIDVVAVCPTLVVGAHDYRLSPSNAYVVNYLNDPFRSTFLGGCNMVSARDVAAGHVIAWRRGKAGCRYVVGSENLEWRQLHELISSLAGTFGPLLTLNHTGAYLAAAMAETSARLAGLRPMVTREEARMAGRFYWYSHERIAALGYAPAPARSALAAAIGWLLDRGCIADSVVRRLVCSEEVQAARADLAMAAT